VVNRALFSKLDEHYGDKVKALDDALISVERKYLEEDADFQTGKPQALYVDFWGDPWQKIGDDPELPQDQRIGYNPWPEPQPFPEPPNTIASFIPAPFLLADYMGVESTKPLSLGYRSGWTAFQEEYTNEPEPQFKGYSGIPHAHVIVKYRDSPILKRYIVGGETSRRMTPSDLEDEIRSGKPV
jgi:hypothetical protein